MAMQVSIDTALQRCEVKFSSGVLAYRRYPARRWYAAFTVVLVLRRCVRFAFVWATCTDTGC